MSYLCSVSNHINRQAEACPYSVGYFYAYMYTAYISYIRLLPPCGYVNASPLPIEGLRQRERTAVFLSITPLKCLNNGKQNHFIKRK